jgi:hypothetical protein
MRKIRNAIHEDIEHANRAAKKSDINRIIRPMVRGLWAKNIENAIVETESVRMEIIIL